MSSNALRILVAIDDPVTATAEIYSLENYDTFQVVCFNFDNNLSHRFEFYRDKALCRWFYSKAAMNHGMSSFELRYLQSCFFESLYQEYVCK